MKNPSFIPALAVSFGCLLCASVCGIVLSSCRGETEAESAMQTPARYREMVTIVPAEVEARVTGSGADGVFVDGRTVSIAAFSIAKYETTWELWKEVYDWAAAHGYRIANRGTEGHGANGTGSAANGWTAEQRRRRPVTDITWRDAVVWCNAYSELCGRTPVYYTADDGAAGGSGGSDGGAQRVLRTSVNNTPDDPSRTGTEADLAVQRLEKDGFRLPLETEWELAARGGSPATEGWDFLYAGGGTGGGIDGIAWYEGNAYTPNTADYGIHPAGTKAAGSAGLFDMSGNAAEWVWDWYNENGITPQTPPEGDGAGVFAHRVTRGGSWRGSAAECAVSARNYCRPFSSGTYLGFRVAQSL